MTYTVDKWGTLTISGKDTTRYYSGTGTVSLFGRTATIPSPSLKNGETVTREQIIKEFRDTDFYYYLTNNQ